MVVETVDHKLGGPDVGKGGWPVAGLVLLGSRITSYEKVTIAV